MVTAPTPGIRFGISIDFGEAAVVAISGELDVASAPEFAAVLDALIERGHPRITVECSQLSFIDASGVGVLVTARARLLSAHGQITLQGVTGLTYRIFEITGLLDMLHVDTLHRHSRQAHSDTGDIDPIIGQVARLASASTRADARADVLSRMTELIPAIMTPCDRVSVTLRRGDHLITAAASDETARDLDALQYRTDDGPCVDAERDGVQTHGAALADERRWRSFTAGARERGVACVLSTPIVADDGSTGALNMYSHTADAFQPVHRDLAHVMAQQTALLLDEPDPTAKHHEFDRRIQDALASREIISRGQGVLMERFGIDARAAFRTLRRDSSEVATSLRRQAAFVVAETQVRPGASQPDRDR